MKIVTKFMNSTVGEWAFGQFVSLLEYFDRSQPGYLRVLTYHRVDYLDRHPNLYPGLISASPEMFEKQIAYLSANYELVSVKQLLTSLKENSEQSLPLRSVLITFDDAYQDFQEFAWPILRSYNVPAALFVPTAFPDHPELSFWWDILHYALTTSSKVSLLTPIGRLPIETPVQRTMAYRLLRDHLISIPHTETIKIVNQLSDDMEVHPKDNPVLSWNEIRKLVAEGLTIGAHTQTHPRLNRITVQESEKEISSSIQDIRNNLDNLADFQPIFAYPGGGVTDQVVKILEDNGIKAAFTTQRGINNIKHDHPLLLRRINVGQRTSLPILRAQLLYHPARIVSKFF